jgi:hypothetical protein
MLRRGSHELVTVISLVGNDVLWFKIGQKSIGSTGAVVLAGSKYQFDRAALRLDRQMKLGAESTARSPVPFF